VLLTQIVKTGAVYRCDGKLTMHQTADGKWQMTGGKPETVHGDLSKDDSPSYGPVVDDIMLIVLMMYCNVCVQPATSEVTHTCACTCI